MLLTIVHNDDTLPANRVDVVVRGKGNNMLRTPSFIVVVAVLAAAVVVVVSRLAA